MKMNKSANKIDRCICGKPLDSWQQLYCSDRCKWIAEKMKTPLGQQMGSVARAVRFFGKLYDRDREHGRGTK